MIGHTSPSAAAIEEGRTTLGIEFGSSTIKAVLIDDRHHVLASGSRTWENHFVDRVWTYPLEAVIEGLQACYASLTAQVMQRYGVQVRTLGGLGISAMMHGYLAFDQEGQLLTPFRTWRNTSTRPAAQELSDVLDINIPMRWSAAHLYQAVLNGEEHLNRLAHLTTLAGYVHWKLTGERVLGVGDASGMFPIDSATGDYDAARLAKFAEMVAGHGFTRPLVDLLPQVAAAGNTAGELTAAGALLLDPSGTLQPGIPMCPPEGDAGTGMVATHAVAPRTGNISVGTSIFAMVVLDRELSRRHNELDLVTTPAGDPVAMVHCNNGASELDAWAGLFTEFAQTITGACETSAVFEALFQAAATGAPDAGGLLAYNYLSGEHNTGMEEGRPLFTRTPDSHLSLGNFMRAQLYSMLATLRIGMDALTAEGIELVSMFGHGGFFKTAGVGQRMLAAAIDTPVSVGKVAAEGGAWGMALLAAFGCGRSGEQSLSDYLQEKVFADVEVETVSPDPEDVAGFQVFLDRYQHGLAIERAAVDHL